MKKILIFLLCFCTIFVCFAIPSFADAREGFVSSGEVFTFNSSLTDYINFYEDILFTSDGVSYSSMIGDYNYVNGVEVWELTYGNSSGSFVVYNNIDGWLNDSYRTIVFSEDRAFSYELKIFFDANEEVNTLYDQFYNLVKSIIYGSRTLNDFESIVLTLISTVFTFAVVALPLIVIFILLKFFIGTIARY